MYIILKTLLIAIFLISAKPKRMFSSKIINSNKYAVILNDNVIIMSSDEKTLVFSNPDNACYNLQNDFQFCTEDGKIKEVVNSNYAHFRDEAFFVEDSDYCNLMKFKITQDVLINGMRAFESQYINKEPVMISFNSLQNNNIKSGKINEKVLSFLKTDTNVVSCPSVGFYRVITKDSPEFAEFKMFADQRYENYVTQIGADAENYDFKINESREVIPNKKKAFVKKVMLQDNKNKKQYIKKNLKNDIDFYDNEIVKIYKNK